MDAQDESLSRAIAASLEDAPGADYFETQPLEERIRKDARCVCTIFLLQLFSYICFRPVALRPTSSPMAYAALLLQSLYYVPQVRHAVAQWGHMYYERQSLLNEGGEVQHPAPGTPGVSPYIGICERVR